jgi:hypothetical protein
LADAIRDAIEDLESPVDDPDVKERLDRAIKLANQSNDYPDPPEGGSRVREPRRPKPTPGSGRV